MTADEIRRTWEVDRRRNREQLNHFFFCYSHPEAADTALLGVRLACAFDGRLIHYICPMLSAVWESDDYTQCDFRPDIRKEILKNVGIKPTEATEYYVQCPLAMFKGGTKFITMQSTHGLNRMEEAFWLPR